MVARTSRFFYERSGFLNSRPYRRQCNCNCNRNAPSKAPNHQVACPSLFWLFFQCCCDVSSGLMRVITTLQLRRQFRANASRNSKWMLRLRRQIPAAVLTKVITPLQLRRLTRAHEIGSSEKARCPQEEEIAEQG